MRTVIIGGVAGGMSAAARLRRLREHDEIIVIERSGYVSFANCGLPYYLGGVIPKRDSLLLQTPEALRARFNLDVRVYTEVTAIDAGTKTLKLRTTGAPSEELEPLRYDKLILSPGATPIRPPIQGIENALTLRDIEDTDRMADVAATAQRVVIVGGGFIGVELAENFIHAGKQVTLVEATNQVMAPLDIELAALVHDALRDGGVDLRLAVNVTGIEPGRAQLSNGEVVPADLVVAAIGVRPDTALALAAGLNIGARGGIAVDEMGRTSDPDIYAVGDAVEKVDALDGASALVPLANTANLQGRRIADQIAGLDLTDRPVRGTAIVGVFGTQVAATGWNEKRLVAAGRAHRVIHTHPASHATYYPGAMTMALKLLVDPDSDAILGAQGVGCEGVDKRIDIIATAMAYGATASSLADLELAYAPAFGSAKDPVNMLGHVAENLRTGTAAAIQWHEVAAAQESGATVIDVRTPSEFAAGAIPGAFNIPLDDLRARIDEVPSGELIVHCAVGIRAHAALRILRQRGHEAVRNLDGGYRTWAAGTSVGR